MTTEFYASGAGDRLIESALLPPAVHLFLAEEERLLSRLVDQLDVLVEVGSMHGLHLDWAVRHGKAYVGLDVVDRYVEKGRRVIADRGLPPSRYQLLTLGAECLDDVVRPPGTAVALFPFNSFGNMPDPAATLDALASAAIGFLISTYGTDETATGTRRAYYVACGYRDLVVSTDPAGVRFTASDGLDTIAYHPQYLLDLAAARGITMSRRSFAQFGALYASRSLAEVLDRAAVAKVAGCEGGIARA